MNIFRNYEEQSKIIQPRKAYHVDYYKKNKQVMKEKDKNSYRRKKEAKINPKHKAGAPPPRLPKRPKVNKKKKSKKNPPKNAAKNKKRKRNEKIKGSSKKKRKIK